MKPQDVQDGAQRKTQPGDPRNATEPSGYKGENPATAGPGPTKVTSNTPENSDGELNPSAPEDSNTTPGSTASSID